MESQIIVIPEERRIPYHATNPAGMRSLVFAPHPDDETFGCGGTLALHAASGDDIKVVMLTSGERGDSSGQIHGAAYRRIRESEAQTACTHLGIEDLEFWAYPDRELDRAADVAARMSDLLERYAPEKVYVPSPLEVHPDHVAAAHHFLKAVKNTEIDLTVVFYEVNQPLRVNCLVNITPVLPIKKQAFAAYQSQLRLLPYMEISLALNRFRSVTLPADVSHAEGFSVWPSAVLKQWPIDAFAGHIFQA